VYSCFTAATGAKVALPQPGLSFSCLWARPPSISTAANKAIFCLARQQMESRMMLSDDTGNKYAMPSHNEPGHHRFIFIIEQV
ncbi:hypothetical protein KZ287_30215, partial [Escherichia coli]|nr:hypothetical protein [Escherichia coli]